MTVLGSPHYRGQAIDIPESMAEMFLPREYEVTFTHHPDRRHYAVFGYPGYGVPGGACLEMVVSDDSVVVGALGQFLPPIVDCQNLPIFTVYSLESWPAGVRVNVFLGQAESIHVVVPDGASERSEWVYDTFTLRPGETATRTVTVRSFAPQPGGIVLEHIDEV